MTKRNNKFLLFEKKAFRLLKTKNWEKQTINLKHELSPMLRKREMYAALVQLLRSIYKIASQI